MHRVLCLILSLLALALFLPGCGRGAVTVLTDGSTSMEPVIRALAAAFTEAHPRVSISYLPTGSGAGIADVLAGACEIGLASRRLTGKEKQAGLTETVLAWDGIALIVHPDNPVTGLNGEDVADILAGTIRNWSAVGGQDAPILLLGREVGSGTRDSLEAITGVESGSYSRELTSTEELLAAVAAQPGSLGYVSVSAVTADVRVLTVNGIPPSEATVKNRFYTLRRPFVLVTRTGEPLSDAAQQFFDFVVSPGAEEIIRAAGAVPAE